MGCVLAVGLALAAGCDDAGEQRKDTATTAPPGKAGTPEAIKGETKTDPGAVEALPQKFKNPAEAIGAYNKCYSDCFSARVSATNRETCKLDCDALAETGMDTLTDEATKTTYKQTWQSLRGCITACFDDRSLNATNRQTCLLTCSDETEVEVLSKLSGPAKAGTPPATGPATGTPPTKSVTPPAKATTPPAKSVTPPTKK
jgi:hypothetical protein